MTEDHDLVCQIKPQFTQKLSLIILNWDRANIVEKIVEKYSQYNCIDDIIIWNNNKNHHLSFDNPSIKTINTNWDLSLDTRYAAFYLAKNDNILLHDDDLELPEESVEYLFQKYLQDPDRIHATHGRNLENGKYKVKDCYGEVDIVLTRAQIINKKYANMYFNKSYLFSSLRKYSCGNGEDIVMNYIVRSITGKKNLAYNIFLEDSDEQSVPKSAISGRKYHNETRQEITNKCNALLNHEDYYIDKNLIEKLKFSDYQLTLGNSGLFYNKYTNTYPYFVHAPGFNKKSQKFKELVSFSKFLKTSVSNEITLITCGDSEDGIFENLCKEIGINVCKLGKTIKKENWSNFIKIKLIHDFLEKVQTKYILFCDNLDVVITKDLKNLLNDFNSFNCEWLFGAEEGIYPLNVENYRLQQEISRKKRYEFLNSGLWIGKTEFIKQAFNEYMSLQSPSPKAINSDQYVYTKCYLNYFPKIQIDFNCKIFMNLCAKKDNSENILVQSSVLNQSTNYEDNYQYLKKFPDIFFFKNDADLPLIRNMLLKNYKVIVVIDKNDHLLNSQLFGCNIIHFSRNINFSDIQNALHALYKPITQS
jgi:hypothetical protein